MKLLIRTVIVIFGLALLWISSLLAATPPTQSVQVQLTWTDTSTDEEGFYIEQCLGAGCAAFVKIGNPAPPNSTTFVDLINNDPGARTICYRVKAFNKAGESPPSNIACLVTPVIISIPSAPSGIVAIIIGVGI